MDSKHLGDALSRRPGCAELWRQRLLVDGGGLTWFCHGRVWTVDACHSHHAIMLLPTPTLPHSHQAFPRLNLTRHPLLFTRPYSVPFQPAGRQLSLNTCSAMSPAAVHRRTWTLFSAFVWLVVQVVSFASEQHEQDSAKPFNAGDAPERRLTVAQAGWAAVYHSRPWRPRTANGSGSALGANAASRRMIQDGGTRLFG